MFSDMSDVTVRFGPATEVGNARGRSRVMDAMIAAMLSIRLGHVGGRGAPGSDLYADFTGRPCRARWTSRFSLRATTAKPRPLSPARAASIVALSASRFVWAAMSLMRPTTSPILLGVHRPERKHGSRAARDGDGYCAMSGGMGDLDGRFPG